ncbi:dethiobiotin synthase [Reichenbachiella sp. MALMAid0571]|uniref:dethiobiotin synthase n=1 Tax=Reichenbachiella sp. MALMAid0571 TaxID=3143939 RepID=UPI0032E0459B
MKKKYFVTGIDTDSGKTIVSAIIMETLKADYWKPVQAGEPTDSDFIRNIHKHATIHPEGIMLHHPMSPHASADLENRKISMNDLKLPKTDNNLIIEGAGGIMVPVNDNELIVDVAKKFDLEVILVSRNYLGSINHTLLSIDYLKRNNFNIKGIVFNGEPNPSSEEYILKHSGLKCLFKIGQLSIIDTKTIEEIATTIKL